MIKKQNILIIGNKLHGKTTFARFLCEILKDAESFSTSSYLIYRLSLLEGISEAEILAKKETYRPKLIKLGNAMCDADAGCLVSICLWSSHCSNIIIDGVRRVSEFNNIKSWFDHIIWIDRPSEPLGLDNLELTSDHGNSIIKNDGDLNDLKLQAKKWLDQH
jgi:hypothetical protein